ncbi:hypothetical protein INT47_000992, partial [Mucor saturninus]
MSNEFFKQLRQKAALINSEVNHDNVSAMQRSLSQMDRELEAMHKRIPPTQELHAKAHDFLASSGIDTDYVSNPINTINIFERRQLEDHTNINKFLQREHEYMLINSVEEQRQVNNEEFDDFFNSQIAEFLDITDRDRMEEDENVADYKSFETDNVSTGANRISEYANVIKTLNANRLVNNDFNLLTNLANIRNLSDLKKSQDGANESWSILSHLINKSGVEDRLEGRFLHDYTTQPNDSTSATNTRRRLIKASKSWLEQQSAQYMNDYLNKNATKVKAGGNPAVTHRLRAFVELVFKTTSGWTDDRFEIVDAFPVWVFIYILIRCGHLDIAAKYVESNAEKFASERRFVEYFKEYVKADHHCVSKDTQESILADYHKFGYGSTKVDPYKLIIYKIIGRCELHKKSFPDVIKTTEDYIWLQLMLVREVTATEKNHFERYRLCDLQREITNLGNEYFDRHEPNPYIFFKILLLTHQFEESIDHLHKQRRLRLEAVHFAIPLFYCGLLKVPPMDKIQTNQILITLENNVKTLNFPRLIYQYVKVYLLERPKEALHYLALLSLYSPKKGYPNNDMVNLARTYVCKFTAESKDFKIILGSSGQERASGFADELKDLLYISSENEFNAKIIEPIAEKWAQTGRCIDAVYAYSLSRDYTMMVDILAKELSDALQKPQSYRITDPKLSQLSNKEIIDFSIKTMNQYESNEYISSLIDDTRKATIRTLIQALLFRVAYEEGRYETALQHIQQADIIPLEGDSNQLQLYAYRFSGLDENVKKNIPELLLNVMDILYKAW